jgi:hypothetical protein
MLNRSLFPLVFSVLLGVSGSVVLAQADGSSGLEPAVPVQKRVLGWVENIRLYPNRMLMKAKLDPGARSSAIHAEDIEAFEENGRRMVRFAILAKHDDPDSDRIVMERPLVREVNIKLRNTTRSDERLAVRLEFCLAGEVHNAVFTLTSRSNFNYPVLLGRQFLKDNTLVDSGISFTHNTNCPR